MVASGKVVQMSGLNSGSNSVKYSHKIAQNKTIYITSQCKKDFKNKTQVEYLLLTVELLQVK